MATKKFGNISENFQEILTKTEKSLGIRFQKHEVENVKTFGELCDIALSKINFSGINDLAHQQAFYKLREAIAITKEIDKQEIQIETKLDDLFPRSGRRKIIRELEFELGFNLKVLRPNLFIEAILILLMFGSIVTLFFSFVLGLEILGLTILLTNISFKMGKIFNVITIGDLAKKITKENYRKSRRNPKTINEQEVVGELELIVAEFVKGEEEITRDTGIV